jgi:hypothetical protein
MLSMSMNTAIRGKGENSIIIRTTGCKNQHSTVMHAITVDGRKLPMYVILKRQTEPKVKLPNGIHVCVQGEGRMDATMVCDWFCTVRVNNLEH